MKSRLSVRSGVILALIALLLSILPIAWAQDFERTLQVVKENAPVHLEPSVTSPVIAYLPRKTALTSYRSENGMYRVMLPAGRDKISSFGYIAAGDVKVQRDRPAAGTDFWGIETKEYEGLGLDIFLGAGPTFFGGGDVADGARGLADELVARLSGEGYSISDKDIGTFGIGAHVFPDFAFHLSPKLSVGIGGSYFYARRLDQFGFTDRGTFRTADGTSTLKAFVIRPSVQVSLPLNDWLSVRLTGGPVFVAMDFKYERNYWTALVTENLRLAAKDTAFGFQAGVALEFRLNPRIGFFVGVHGQSARAGSFEGDEQLLRIDQNGLNTSEPAKSGTLIFMRRNGFPVLTVPGSGGAESAVLDFSGIGFSAGVKVRL